MELLGILALLWLGGAPLAAYAGARPAIDPQVLHLDPERVDPSILTFLDDSLRAMERLGFVVEAFVHLPDAYPGVESWLALCTRRATGDMAMVAAIVNPGATPPRRVLYTEFSTRFLSRKVVNTLNASTMGALRTAPEESRVQAPQVQDVALLHRLHGYHRREVARIPDDEIPVVFPEGTGARFVADLLRRTHEAQEKIGVLRRDNASGRFIPTALGACEMGFRVAPPMAQLRAAAVRHRAKLLLEAMARDTATEGDRTG